MEKSKSLAPHTGKVFETISKLECIKPYTLVGGTALSLQIEKRQSEDLDFTKWITKKGEKHEVDWPAIKKELESVGEIKSYEIGSLEHVSFDFEGVKLSFYAAPRKAIPSMERISYLNNLYVADIASIGAMKMETMLRRSKFRDYYDIYSILKEGVDIQQMQLWNILTINCVLVVCWQCLQMVVDLLKIKVSKNYKLFMMFLPMIFKSI